MHVITCLFYAVASFALGAIAYTGIGAQIRAGGGDTLMNFAQLGAELVMIAGPLLFVAAAAIQRDHLTSR